ncbi:MAG: hypothetical protein AD742_11935 [Methylibium sp. NZG]|nr:MAG: hypothetical protein AD742_11935 [Methylibium sp. NZG]
MIGVLATAAAPFVYGQGAPFVCDATAYSIATGQLATAAYSTTTGLVSAEIPLGTPWSSGAAPALNSLGYNYQDNYLYAVARSSDGTGLQQLIRIGSAGAGSAVVVANITGLNPASPNLLTAAAVVVETPAGPRYYIAGENGVAPFTTQLYEINLTTGAATNIGTPVPYRIFDIAVRPTDGAVLFVASSLTVPDFTIYRWDTTTGVVSPYSTYTGPTPSNAGGIVFSRDGRFMLIRDLNNLNWLTIDLATATSAIGATIPPTPEHDAASCAPQTVNLSLAKANPASFTVGVPGNYTLTLTNGANAVTSPAVEIVNDRLPPNFTYNSAAPGAGATAASCTASGTLAAGLSLVCTVTTPAGIPAGGSASFTISVTPQAAAAGVPAINKAALDPGGGVPPVTVPDACTANNTPAGCALTPPITPTAAPPADMSVTLGASTPTVVRPGQTFAGLTLTCTNAVGSSPATTATCVPTASAGTVSNVVCTPASGSTVAAGASIACTYDYAAPGTQGGADEATTAVTFTGTTGATNDTNAANNVATLVATVIDALTDTDSKPGGSTGQTSNLSTNDQFPPGSVFSVQPGGTCTNGSVSAAGIATYDVVASGNCTVNYQVCAPAPNATTCDTATLTVTAASADMSPVFTGLPGVSAPGSAVAGSIVCTNAGPAAAANATCTTTAVDSSGVAVPVTVGVCTASSGSAASLPAGATLTCAVSYLTPGTAGGSDTAPVAVTLTGTTGAANDTNGGTTAGGNNSVAATVVIIDAVNDSTSAPPGSTGQTSNVATNDQFPPGSTFTVQPGGTCVAASVSTTGTATFNVPASGTCTVNYQVCAPAPNAAACDTATLTVTAVATISDMTPAFSGLPAVSAPGSVVSGSLVCSNIGAVAATAATCAATAADSTGAPVVLTVGACVASSGSAASLPTGATLTCPVSYTTPGTTGGTNTTPVAITLTGTTGATNDSNGGTGTGGNNSTAATIAIIDALNDTASAPFGNGGTLNLLANDTQGAAAATAGAGGNVTVALALVTPLPPGITLDPATGVLTIAPGTPAGTYPVTYQICALPAQAPPQCDTAIATVTILGKVDVVKAVGVPLQVGPSSFELPYVVVVGNAGPAGSTVFNVQADENLPSTFGSAATAIKAGSYSVVATGGTCTPNAAFNGTSNTRLLAGTDDLAGGQRCTIRFTVVVTFAGAVPTTPLVNSVYASAVADDTTPNPGYTFPGGTPTPPPVASSTDVSTAGTSPPAGSPPGTPPAPPNLPPTPGSDPATPTVVTLAQQQLGAAKRVVSVTATGTSAYSVVYEVTAANTGTVPATNVQIAENLSATFPPPASVTAVSGLSNPARVGASTAQCAVNPAFSLGNTNLMTGQTSLDAAQSCMFRFTVVFAPNGSTGPFNNTAIVSSYPAPAATPGGTPAGPPIATDRSDSGTNPTGTNPGAPGDTGGSNDPTPLTLPGAISGSVWSDTGSSTGGNRVRDPSEAGLAGFTVEVLFPPGTVINGINVGGQVVLTASGAPATAQTDANGNYSVVGVPEGSYQVRFRAPGPAGGAGPVIGIPVNGENNNPQPNSTLDLTTRTLLVTVAAGTTVPQQSLPVDPSGVVYDSTSRLPIGGALVELLGPGGTPLPAACVLPGQQGQTTAGTGATAGFYRFDLLPGANAACPAAVTAYTIRVTPPAGYGLPPSRAIAPSAPLASQSGATYAVVPQATAPAQGQPTTYHLVISLGTGSAQVIHNHIPLDPNVAAELLLQKAADKTQVTIGDSVQYRIRVRNTNAFAVPGVRVVDTLPLGFRMIAGSATLQLGVATVTRIADTAITGFPGPKLIFDLGLMPANSEALIVYRVRLGIGADKGTGVNVAYVEAGPTRSGAASAGVKVSGGVFAAEACVIGKVFVDCNQNKVQDSGEPGIPGMRLYMEDGTNVTTDENGQYSLCGVRAITHVLKIDPQSAPVGARFGVTSSRNAGDAESLFIDLKNGELHRADFREQSCFPKVLEQVNQRRRLGPVYVPQKQVGKDEPWGIQFNSDQHKVDRTPAARPADGGGR